MKKYTVIANPTAGHGNGLRAIPHIRQLFNEFHFEYDLVITERVGHATELAFQATQEGCPIIVGAGGDGTLNEIVNGLMRAGKAGLPLPAIGVLGVGRGNDFGGSVGIPTDLKLACQVLAEDHRRKIDIGCVYGGLYPEGRYFINCVGVGFDAIGTIEAAKLPRWGGFLSFFVAILKTIFLYNKAPLATIKYDSQNLTQRSLMISIMNGRRLGGAFWMAPDAKQNDGLLDLCIAQQMSPVRIFMLIPHFLRGTQASQKTITTGRAATIEITGHDGSLPAQTDGEIICLNDSHLEIELLPRQIDVILPSRRA